MNMASMKVAENVAYIGKDLSQGEVKVEQSALGSGEIIHIFSIKMVWFLYPLKFLFTLSDCISTECQ